MPLKDIMRFTAYLLFLTFFSCSSGSQKSSTPVDTTISKEETDAARLNDEEDDVDFRQEFISQYQKQVLIDTFFLDDGKKYEILFHHFSTMDNGLVVPAKYNFDINKDFVTHNFVSDLTVFSKNDTLFKKHITKSTFSNLLDTLETPLKEHATLLYPTLSIDKDSIQIHYSISIPVTDVGNGVRIKFDKKGNYVIEDNGM